MTIAYKLYWTNKVTGERESQIGTATARNLSAHKIAERVQRDSWRDRTSITFVVCDDVVSALTRASQLP